MSVTTTPISAVSPSTVVRILKAPLWEERLSEIFWINSVAISDNGGRVVGATFIHDYKQRNGRFQPNVVSRFGVHCFDSAKNKLWSDEYDGWDGVFGVAISGDGKVAAAGGWLDKNANTTWGLVRAYDAGTGKKLLDYSGINQRVGCVALSQDGSILAAAADDVYVFLRDGVSFNPVPLRLGVGGIADRYVTSVAIHPTKNWLAACDQLGHVYVAKIQNGILQRVALWPAPTGQVELPFLSVAIARNKETFVVGGGNFVYLFDYPAIVAGNNTPIFCDTTDANTPGPKPNGRLQENIRWVAISADGTKVTAVANRNNGLGILIALDGALQPLWSANLEHNPNSTSIDWAGKYVTVADGYPTSKPANFCLFDGATGQELWHLPTCNMNWPMVISPDATAIIAGGDDGTLYYFKPVP